MPSLSPGVAAWLILAAAAAIATSPGAATAATYEADGLEVTAHGVGPINAHTVFDRKTLQAALPGYKVRIVTMNSEGGSYQAALVRRDKRILMQINTDEAVDTDGRQRVFSVIVRAPEVANALGPVVGTPYPQAMADFAVAKCEMGEEEYSGALMCPSAQVNNVFYALRGKHDGPDGEVPPDAVLKRFTVREILWVGEVMR